MAVRPTDVAAVPETYVDLGLIFAAYRNRCDFPNPGSPNRSRCISPRVDRFVPGYGYFVHPENSVN